MNLGILDQLPLASIIAILGIIGAIIALIAGSIDFEQFMLAVGAATGGAGVLGVARNGAGRGMRAEVSAEVAPADRKAHLEPR